MPTGIDYILETKKPYPNWITNHRIFKSISRIEKVFPLIGLANYSEDCNIIQTESASSKAKELIYWFSSEFVYRAQKAKAVLDRKNKNPEAGREYNQSRNELQHIINLTGCLHLETGDPIYCVNTNGDKISLSPRYDIFSGSDENPVFKKGESLIKITGKINEMLAKYSIPKIDYEQNSYYKDFCRLNVPTKPFQIHFSSTGEDGAWNIATASMRGIESCQAWKSLQSRGLIGTISSKYVGVIFIEGSKDYHPYGKQMIYRSFVRLIIEKATGKPFLYLDTIYPSSTPEVIRVMKESLQKRTNIPIIFCNYPVDKNFALTSCIVMNEPNRTYLREGEYSYMDTQIPVVDKPIATLKHFSTVANLTGVKSSLFQKVNSELVRKINTYQELGMLYKDLENRRAKGEEIAEKDKPVYLPLFSEPRIGPKSVQTILNFYKHFSSNNAPIKTIKPFIDAVIDAIPLDANDLSLSNVELRKKMYRQMIMHRATIRATATQALATGSWNRSFARTSDRFLTTTISVVKQMLLEQINVA